MATLGEPRADFLPSGKTEMFKKLNTRFGSRTFLPGIANIQIDIGRRIGVPNSVRYALLLFLRLHANGELSRFAGMLTLIYNE